MTPHEFRLSLSRREPPPDLHGPLEALWWDGRNDWERAHAAVARDDGETGAWVHAYLHRKEGDLGNADYWYRMAKKPVADGALTAEWDFILSALLPA